MIFFLLEGNQLILTWSWLLRWICFPDHLVFGFRLLVIVRLTGDHGFFFASLR